MNEINCRLVAAILTSAVNSGFQHGYHTGFSNIPGKLFEDWILHILTKRNGIKPSDGDVRLIWSTIMAMYSMGGILGSLLTLFVVRKIGCKNGLIWNNVIVVVGILLLFFSHKAVSFEMFMIGRLLVGINAGLSSGLCPMYLVDIAPVRIRGAIASFYQFMITVGIFLSQCSSFALGTADQWPYIFGLALLPTIFQIVTLPFIPESPRYLLITKEEESETERVLQWFKNSKNVFSEMEILKQEDSLVKELRPVTLKRIWTDANLRMRLLICLILMCGQQLCGINAVSIYFSTEIFEGLGYDELSAAYITIALGLVNALVTFVSLFVIDVYGRKVMLLSGFMGLSLDTISLTISLLTRQSQEHSPSKYLCVLFIYVFILCYAPGIGTVPWFIATELFYYTARPLGVSLTAATNWLSNYLVMQTFKIIAESIGSYVLLIFAFLDFFFFFYTYLYLPETAKKSPKEIVEIYK